MSKVTYHVVSDDDPMLLGEVINQVLADGGVLEGGIAVRHRTNGYSTFYQAYTIEEDTGPPQRPTPNPPRMIPSA